jgi:hypothetical protein
MSGTNPLFEGKDNLRTGGDNDCDGVADLTVYLIDADNGNTVATTQTESCGEFFFANVPTGNYIVKIAGTVLAKKGYDAFIKNKMDLAGEILSADDYWAVELTTDTGSVEQAIIKTKTKSNQSNDRVASSQQNNTGMVWSPRSNIKILPLKTGDVDGDGIPETLVGNNNSGAYEVMRGAPLKGVGVSLGKIPGGGVANKTVQTNEYGEFEFTDLEPGNYTLTADLHYTINDETYLSVGNNIVTSESNLKGEPKITASQNSQSLKTGINNGMPNRISMNLTVPKQTQGSTFGERVNAGLLSNNNNQLGAQNNNTVRSNRTDNAVIVADMDGDGAMESSYLNFNGEIATLTLFEGGVQASQNANATGGINILEDNTSNSKVVEKATSGLKDVVKTQVRMAGNTGLNKWVAPELLNKKLQGNPQIDEATSTLILGNASMDKVEKGKWQIAPVSLKSIPCANGACVAITANGADYPSASNVPISSLLTIGQPVAKASFIFTDNSGKIYKKETDASGRLSFAGLPTGTPLTLLGNFGVDGNDDILLLFTTDAQGKPSCNVLKTKHDTVKNSIQNVR